MIENYNKSVIEKIEKSCKDNDLEIRRFKPTDIKGKEHCLGLFDNDGEYKEFITLGAKKYAYKDKKDNKIHITVSGIPKSGSKALKSLKDFKSDFVFSYKDTNKNMIAYLDEMTSFNLEDYKGKKLEVKDKYGCCLLPTTYTLGISQEYFDLLTSESSSRAIFREV